MVAASAANFGLWRTWPHMLGIALGFPAMLLLVALGAAEALRDAPRLQAVLRWAGAAWMLWLAWGIATAAPADGGSSGHGTGRGIGPGTGRGRPMRLLEAALFQWVNPKAWLIAFGGTATYAAGQGQDRGRAVALAAIFALVSVPSNLAWAALGAGTSRLLRTPRALRAFNWVMAGLLVLSLLPLLVG